MRERGAVDSLGVPFSDLPELSYDIFSTSGTTSTIVFGVVHQYTSGDPEPVCNIDDSCLTPFW